MLSKKYVVFQKIVSKIEKRREKKKEILSKNKDRDFLKALP